MKKNEYDLSFWINGTYGEEKAQEVFNKVKEDLLALGVTIITEKISELKKLAYEIKYSRKHYTHGYFCTIIFDATNFEEGNIKRTLDKMFKYSEDIIRFLVIEHDVYTKFSKEYLEGKKGRRGADHKEVIVEGEEIAEKEIEEVKEETVNETNETIPEEVVEDPEITDEQLDDKIEEALK